jgi:hypothetical protein
VFYDEESTKVWKATKPGLFGENYFLSEGRVTQRNCSPFDYLLRLRFWSEALGESSLIAFGVTRKGQIVSRQAFIKGTPPSQVDVDAFLKSEGFQPVQDCWLWEIFSSHDRCYVGLGDARSDNFVQTPNGIVPIDIRLWASRY